MGKKGRLPSGYEELKYIEGARKQAIRTGIVLDPAFKISVMYQLTSADLSITQRVCGNYYSGGSEVNTFAIQLGYKPAILGKVYFQAFTSPKTWSQSPTPVMMNVDLDIHTASLAVGSKEYSYDGDSYQWNSLIQNVMSDSGSDIAIFGSKANDDPRVQNMSYMKLYSAEIENSSRMVELTPALRKADSKELTI